jgi:hypothetical protein
LKGKNMKKTNSTKKTKSNAEMSQQKQIAIKHSKFLKTAGIICGVTLLALVALVVTKDVFASIDNSTVKPEDVKDISMVDAGSSGWYKSVAGSGSLAFNGDVPFNDLGNAAFTVNDVSSSVELGIYHTFPSVRFDNLWNLTYATYVPARAEKAVTLQIDVDLNVTDADTSFQGRMVFDPANNLALANIVDPNRLPLTADKWQTWQVVEPGSKWSLTWEGNAEASTQLASNPCPKSTPCSFEQIMTLFPDAGMNNGTGNSVVLRAGDGWNNLKGYADALSIEYSHVDQYLDIAYNFEPSDNAGGGGEEPTPNLPLSKEQCYNDGWKNFGDTFKNQGQCVSYVVHSNQDL